jgi:hypothetical protein
MQRRKASKRRKSKKVNHAGPAATFRPDAALALRLAKLQETTGWSANRALSLLAYASFALLDGKPATGADLAAAVLAAKQSNTAGKRAAAQAKEHAAAARKIVNKLRHSPAAA